MMDVLHLALSLILVLAGVAFAFVCLPDPPRDPDEVERGSTTILPEDR